MKTAAEIVYDWFKEFTENNGLSPRPSEIKAQLELAIDADKTKERIQSIRDKIQELEKIKEGLNPEGFDHKFRSINIFGLKQALKVIEEGTFVLSDEEMFGSL